MLSVTSPARNFWKPAEELNLVPFRPALRRFGLEDRCRERGPQFWCPRKDLNLQPLVCRTSAPSIELLGHVFGGRSWIRTNLSGFSDHALIHLSYPTNPR